MKLYNANLLTSNLLISLSSFSVNNKNVRHNEHYCVNVRQGGHRNGGKAVENNDAE